MKACRTVGRRVSGVLVAVSVIFGIAVLVLFGDPQGYKSKAHASPSISPEHVLDPVSQIPMSFEPNQGQTDSQVRFLSRGSGYGLFLTSDQAVLKLQHQAEKSPASISDGLHMTVVGANPNVAISASEPLPGKSNYLIGSDPSKWHTNVPHYARVAYQQVYPGIDLVYYGKEGRLEYDFQLAPGADSRLIQLSFAGQRLGLDAQGNLIIRAGSANVQFLAPVAYQEVAGKKRTVQSRFVLLGHNRVGFELGYYDLTRKLVIDPVLSYSSYFGGGGQEACGAITGTTLPGCPAIAVDSALNYYVAGSTTSTDFPTKTPSTTAGPLQTALAGTANAFVSKFDINNNLIFSTYLGGNGTDFTAGVAADSAGNAYVAGTTTSTNFPTLNGFNNGPTSGGTHVFLSELKPDGTGLLYSTYFAGTKSETASGLAIDGKGDAFVSGITSSSDFPTTPNALQSASLSPSDSQFFLAKVNVTVSGSSSLVYSTYFGGGNPASGAIVQGGGVAVDSTGNAYITGGTNFLHVGNSTTDFPILNASQDCLDTHAVSPVPNPPPACDSSATRPDAFVAKINPNAVGAASLVYSTYLGGEADDTGYGIAVDTGSTVYVTGSTNSTQQFFPTTNVFQSAFGGGGSDAFLARLNNPAANSPVMATYFTYLGGGGDDVGAAVAADASGIARVTGWTTGSFPVNGTTGFTAGPGGGGMDAFLARVDTTGTATPNNFSTAFGGSGVDHGTGIALDPNFVTYVAGDTASGDFPTAGTPHQAALLGPSDIFISKIGSVPSLTFNTTTSVPSATTVGVGNPVTFKYVITNSGDPVGGVIFTDNLPSSGATFGSITSSPGTCTTPSGTTVVCSIGTLASGATATISVTITPTTASPAFGNSGTVSATGSSSTSSFSESVAVTDFSVGVSGSTPTSVPAGSSATYQVTVTPIPTFPNSVSLSCSAGLPTGAACTFSTTSVTMTNTSPATSTLTISTTARPVSTTSLRRGIGLWYAVFLPVSGIAFIGAGFANARRRKWLMGMCLVAVLGTMVTQSACSGSSSQPPATGGTPAGTYNVTVTGTSGSATRTATATLIVN